MQLKPNQIFSLIQENQPRKGLTISQTLFMEKGKHMTVFSLADGTEISEEYYPNHYGYLVLQGTLQLIFCDGEKKLTAWDGVFLSKESTYRVKAVEDVIYVEIEYQEEQNMNLVNANEIFQLKELLPVEAGKIVNADLVNTDAVKIVVMSFGAGCELPEHAAPGEALFFCLEGEGIITTNGTPYPIKGGENFVFAPGELHSVKAVSDFKMALVLVKNK